MNYNSPKDIAAEFCCAGLNKAKMPIAKFALLALLGGTFIAFGGLLTVVVAGGDLFTSNCAGVVLPYLQKQLSLSLLIKVLAISYIFNFVGTQFITYFMSSELDLFAHQPWQSYLHKMGENKLNQSFYTIFLKGVGANWLVCLGAWMGFAGKDVVSKCVGIWVPVMIFVASIYWYIYMKDNK